MSLVKIPNKLIDKLNNVELSLDNGINISHILRAKNLYNLCIDSYYKNGRLEADYAMVVNMLSNIGDIRQVQYVDGDIFEWGFVHKKGRMYISETNSQVRPVIFR